MRALVILVMVVIVAVGSSGLWAADVPLENDAEIVETPAYSTLPPVDVTIPPPLISGPRLSVPSPISPSEPPTGYSPIPTPPVPEQPGPFIDFSASDIRTTFDEGNPAVTIARGNVTARYRQYIVTSDYAEADYRTNIAYFEGNVVFRTGALTVTGERIILNIRTGEWSFIQGNTRITPEFAEGYLNAPVFVEGTRVEGYRQRQFFAYDTAATTCNLAHPHYELVSRYIAIYPNDKIVARDITTYILDKKLFTIPRIVIPLREIQRNPRLIPRFGQSEAEGFFVKTAYTLLGDRNKTVDLLLDLMTRKGVGTGITSDYKVSRGGGALDFYYLNDRSIDETTLMGHFDHSQRLGTLNLGLSSDFRDNSYLYAPNSKTLRNQLTLTRNRPTANSLLNLSQNIDNVFQRTSQLSGTIKHVQSFGPDTRIDAGLDYFGFNANDSTRAQLISQFAFENQQDKFDWSLSARELTDLSDEAFVGRGGFAGVERLPELALASDTQRLGQILPFNIPARFLFSYGLFSELPEDIQRDRAYLQIDSPTIRRSVSPTWTLASGAGFRQFVYSEDEAQYAVNVNAELNKKIGEESLFALTYRYQKPRGFTPFRFDFIGDYNILNARFNLQETQRLRMSILAGYNFEQDNFPWQDIVLRLSYQPTNSFLLYAATGYDINTSRWRTLINQLRIRAGDRFKLDIGTRYDTTRSKLATIATNLDMQIDRKTRIQAVAGYNGFTSSLDYSSVMITRDLHCWEAQLVYTDQQGFFEDKSIMINFRIKAFPLFQNFGVGAFGQSLDTSVGQVY